MARFERWLAVIVLAGSVLTGAGWDYPPAADQYVRDLIGRLETKPGDGESYNMLRRLGPLAGAAAPTIVAHMRASNQTTAINALLGIGPHASLPPLLDALRSDDKKRALAAAQMLAVFGPAASAARPALLVAAADPVLQGEAVAALNAIDGVRPALHPVPWQR